MPPAPASPSSSAPSTPPTRGAEPALPPGRELCLRACAALLAAGYAPDQFVVVLEGRRYAVATAPRAALPGGGPPAGTP